MDKLLLFPGKTEKGIFTFVVDVERSHLVKTAAEYHPEIGVYINSAKAIPGKTQILLTALGAGEVWGSNVNGDYFPEAGLRNPGDEYGFKTFERFAKIYKHHINKDPTASYGDVTLAVYNEKYHRVELIVMLDNAKAPDIAERINSGDYPEWSMGCRVPYDECSNCGNKAPTRKEYCECLKYYMGRIHPETGKMVYAINRFPKFFDISQVLIGADKIAKTLKKVAFAGSGARPALSSAYIAEKIAEGNKVAEIEKEVPASSPPASQDAIDTLVKAIPEIKAQEKPFPTALLDQLGTAGKDDLSSVFSTMAMLGILPKPQEFQRIVLISIGKKDVADQLDAKNLCFDPMMVPEPYPIHEKILALNGDRAQSNLIDMLAPHVEERSYATPHLAKRIIVMVKKGNREYLPTFVKSADAVSSIQDTGTAERKPVGILPLLMLTAGLYAAFSKKAPEQAIGKLDRLIASRPGLAAALGIGLTTIFNHVAGEHIRGQFNVGMHENPDVNDMMARIDEQKQKPYLKVASAIGPASKRLFLGIPAVYMASGVLQKHREANPYEQEGRVRSFVRKNPDIIGAALAVDAMMALRGKGSYGATKAVAPAATAFWNKSKDVFAKALKESPAIKTASAQDFITNSLVWPIAFGGRGLPGRIVGGMFDQAVLEGSKKVLSNKHPDNKLKPTDQRS